MTLMKIGFVGCQGESARPAKRLGFVSVSALRGRRGFIECFWFKDGKPKEHSMHDFGKITYLDLHKTGSFFVSDFLQNCCRLRELKFVKHGWIEDDFRLDCAYFITIRNPLDLYSSLYRYGLDSRGQVFVRMQKRGLLGHYQSFDTFVRFLLDAENADILGFGYRGEIACEMGFMSFRFLRLSLQYPDRKIEQQLQRGRKLSALESEFITSHELRTETLAQDLKHFALETYPHFFHRDAVEPFLATASPINKSSISHDRLPGLSAETLANLNLKESLLINRWEKQARR